MTTLASQTTSLTIVYSIVYSDADQRKHQSSMSLAFVWEIHRWPVNSPHKRPVTSKMFPFDDVIMLKFIMHNSVGVRSLIVECHRTSRIRSQHWFRHQAISWTNVGLDLCHHMASLNPKELHQLIWSKQHIFTTKYFWKHNANDQSR